MAAHKTVDLIARVQISQRETTNPLGFESPGGHPIFQKEFFI